MTETTSATWEQANRDALVAELGVLRALLRHRAGEVNGPGPDEARAAAACAQERLPGPSALDQVVQGFGLTTFERSALLLAAGPELVAAAADEIAAVGGDPRPTFALALSTLPEASWGAMTPTAPLRRWQLLRLLDPTSLTRTPLLVAERVLHHLVGAGYLDPELAAVARPASTAVELADSLREAADAVAAAWADGRLVVLSGPQRENLTTVAAAAGQAAGGQRLFVVSATDLPRAPADRDHLLRLMERESVLAGCAWAIDLDGARADEVGGLLRALPGLGVPAVLLATDDTTAPAGAVRVSVPRLGVQERHAMLSAALRRHRGTRPGPDDAATLATAGVFDLAVADIEAAAEDVGRGRPLWEACRTRARSRFAGMAQVVEPRAGWDDLVLPAGRLDQLRALVAGVRHRATVLDDWGFADRSARGLGTAALFAGPSGTGKTLAAEVVAGALALDLVVVDLSQVVSKYIGETEKNLRRVFDAAEDSAAVLLFDEADTLFGKRTEVRDSHDRYANLEVGYLLQRIESFRGLAVLTTNARSVLDQAFLRRLRVVVTFPYPDLAAREAMWRRAFPPQTPTSGLDPRKLAGVDLPGGGIAAAALTAAYLGADRGEVNAADVAAATRWELAKTGRTVPGRK
ncbi:ATP-binding protein [Actinopolymorpha sp. B17G11]|uniref:ATP-binding protein n=1 Tax=Actinopolymorpha sp. B17G11 TaxID=3160861 RepID=UPI0032E4F76E